MKRKWRFSAIVWLLSGAIALFFANNYSLLSIEQTALVVAIGIDVVEEEAGKDQPEYELSVQIAVPEGGGAATERNQQETVSARGNTVTGALRLIGQSCGWYPKMNFCSLVLLGEKVAERNVMRLLDCLIVNFKMQDAANLVLCQGKAKDVLNSATPLDNVPSFALGKIFSVNARTVSGVNPVTVKEFAEQYYGRSQSGYMPYLCRISVEKDGFSMREMPEMGENIAVLPPENTKIIPVPDAEKEKNGGEGGGGSLSGGGTGGSSNATGTGENKKQTQGGETDQVDVFNAAFTMLFHKGKAVALLESRQSLTQSFLTSKGKEATFPVYDVPKTGEMSETYFLSVVKIKKKVSLVLEEGFPVLKIDLRLTAKTEDEAGETERRNAGRKNFLPEEVQRVAEEQMTEYLEQIFALCKKTNCDMLGLAEKLYQRYPEHYERLKDRLYEEMREEISVSFVARK